MELSEGEIKYKFEAQNLTDFNLYFLMRVPKKLFNLIFKKSQKALFRKDKDKFGILKEADIESIACFEVPAQYYHFIKTTLTSYLRKISMIVRQDGIIVLGIVVTSCQFIKDDNLGAWLVNITFQGQYTEEEIKH